MKLNLLRKDLNMNNELNDVLGRIIDNNDNTLDIIRKQSIAIEKLFNEINQLKKDNENIRHELFALQDFLGRVEHD
jgi:hypothetical protein